MTDDGVVSLSDRFANIEAMLRAIDSKLDRKVDVAVFETLVRRVENVESGETPLGRIYVRQFEQMNIQLNDLINNGSRHMQTVTKEVTQLRSDVDKLEAESTSQRAILRERQDRLNRHSQRSTIYLALVSLLALCVSVVGMILTLH